MSATVYRRAAHAAHYMYGHPKKGHDLESWDVTSPKLTKPSDVPANAEYHHGYIDREGKQHWVFVRPAPLTPGDCPICRGEVLAPEKEHATG